ncbi:MAG: AI-2E family transporter [Akkermansiaceae bacterium]|nr:AI-2E family transporter [Akkermansiaceae bacterium]
MSEPEKKYPTVLQQRVMWTALSLLSLSFIVVLASACAYGMVKCFAALEAVLLPVLIAGILAYLLNPLVIRLQKKVVRRVWAVLIVMFGALLLVLGLCLCIIPPLINQSKDLYDKREMIAGDVVATTRKWLQEDAMLQQVVDILYNNVDKNQTASAPDAAVPEVAVASEQQSETELGIEASVTADSAAGVASSRIDYETKVRHVLEHHSTFLLSKSAEWLTAGGRVLFSMVYVVVGIIVVPVFLFYFLLETEPIARNWDKVLPLRNSHLKDEIVATLSEINQNVVAFVRGQLLVSLIDAFFIGIALWIMGLPYALTIAAAVAILGIIPYIGMILTSIPAILIAWFSLGGFGPALAVAIIFLSVSQFDGWFLQPKIVGKNMKMHDMTVMFSVLFWSLVFGGVLGALVAVPLTAAIKVIFKRYVWVALTEPDSQA